ncbi:hypothetical protein JYU34_008197 [Plutella xylostella]|uniref:Uncharacterized protein n=1 Tax=Plutella xylostella TaxID=51655 RepID=A0ABQ7QNY4_PLUXY|nr:hypothetical protein JYU34_008197 [Plutella xylostella]
MPNPIFEEPNCRENPCYPCCCASGPRCFPCGMDAVTLRRPLIVGDSTFEYRATNDPSMIRNRQNKKVRYVLVNFTQKVSLPPPACPSCAPRYMHF